MTDPLFALDRHPSRLGPGAVHIPGWLDRRQQEYLLRACLGWTEAVAPRHVTLPGGGRMSVRTLSLGRRWEPYRYVDAPGTPPLPEWLVRAGSAAVADAARIDPEVARARFEPDVGLVNFYGPGARMGTHVDADEESDDPVVSLSLGDECVFRFGTPDGPPFTDVRLCTGDLVVFGGPSRRAVHGVPRVDDASAPAWAREVVGAHPGRVNITLRRSRPAP